MYGLNTNSVYFTHLKTLTNLKKLYSGRWSK